MRTANHFQPQRGLTFILDYSVPNRQLAWVHICLIEIMRNIQLFKCNPIKRSNSVFKGYVNYAFFHFCISEQWAWNRAVLGLYSIAPHTAAQFHFNWIEMGAKLQLWFIEKKLLINKLLMYNLNTDYGLISNIFMCVC